MDAWTAECVKQTGSQNNYVVDGERYFWEVSRTEHADGAITGQIFRMVNDTQCVFVRTFRINGDGSIARAPKFLANIKA